MQALVDFFPLIAFFVAYKIGGIYVATATLMIACVLQIGWQWLRHRKVKTMHWVTGGLVLLFGSVTLLLHDPMFIKLKVSVLMWLLCVAFLVSQFMSKPLSRRLLEGMIENATGAAQASPLNPRQWGFLNLVWVVFFGLVGAANLYIAQHFSESTWVNFKFWALPILTVLFILPQVVWLLPKETQKETPS